MSEQNPDIIEVVDTTNKEQHSFQADAQQILKLVTHSIYSDREIFLRELLSNSSDALDKARFVGLSEGEFRTVENPGIRISFNEEAHTITIEDDGIGMTRDEVIENLGTIAQSGTKKFMEGLDSAGKLESMIGQFGVGFYSAFMIADKVVVDTLSIKEGEEAIRWESDGTTGYSLADSDKNTRGTRIMLFVREDAHEFVDQYRLENIAKKHSSFIQWPIHMGEEQLNEKQAIWTREPSEVSEEEYVEFYKHLTKDYQEPLAHAHFKMEGSVSFSAVLFIPQRHSLQLDNMNYKVDLRLFQKRVQVLEHANDLLPTYLRFVCGIVDSPDVELNVSREILQKTRVVELIKKQLTKKVLEMLKTMSKDDTEKYNTFWNDMGMLLKGGIPEDQKNKDKLVELFRCKTTTSNGGLRSLAEMKEDMKEGQDTLWYLSNASNPEQIGNLPILEGFKKRDWEVMLLTDAVDEWVTMTVQDYQETPVKSVSQGEFDDEEDEKTQEDKDKAQPLVEWLGELLANDVSEVRLSNRLTDSPSVLVDADGGMSSNFQNIMKALNPGQAMADTKRVLEINPSHPLVQTLSSLNAQGATDIEPFARLLLDHAAIAEGQLKDPQGFAKRLQGLMAKAASAL
jgi:molecular chaperone HtpG